MVRHADEFRQSTGRDLDLQVIPSDLSFSNEIHRYLDGEDRADVYMSGPVLRGEHIGAEYVEPLDPFLARAGADFDIEDFFGPLLTSNRWTGKFGDRLGAGALWEIPVNCETYNLAYVPALLEQHGCDVPRTWDQFFATAGLLQQKSHGSTRGFAQRGTRVWHTMYTGYATQFWAYGAGDFDEQGTCAIASAQGIAATHAFVEGLRRGGPSEWLNQRWYELAMDFAAGRRESNMWTWSLVMNSRSRDKENARRLIESDARVLITPVRSYLKVGERWVRAPRSAFAGDEGVAEALESAAADIDSMRASH